MNNEIKKDQQDDITHKEPKNNPSDTRKNPRPGYDEKNPTKKNIQPASKDQDSKK